MNKMITKIINKMLIPVVFALSIIMVNSCTYHGITSNTIMKLQKGMTPDTIQTFLIDDLVVKEILMDNIKGKQIIVDIYMKSMGEIECEYMIAFADKKLVYFGYPYEFASHTDTFINEIGKQTMIKYKEE
jgi:hypothetical protein